MFQKLLKERQKYGDSKLDTASKHVVGVTALFCALYSWVPYVFSDDEVLQYEVKEHDQIGKILEKFKTDEDRLWGKNGLVQKTIRINRKVLKKNGDFITPNTVIALPIETKEPLPLPPPPPAAPTPTLPPETAAPEQEQTRSWLFSFFNIQRPKLSMFPLVEFTQIKSTDITNGASTSAVTNLVYGTRIVIEQHLVDKGGYEVEAAVKSVTFQNSPPQALNRYEQPHSLQSKFIGSLFTSPFDRSKDSDAIWRKIRFKLGGGAGEEFFFIRKAASLLSIEKTWIPRISIGVDAPLTKLGTENVILSVIANATLLMPALVAAMTVEMGHEESLGTRIETHLGASHAFAMGAQVFGKIQNQNTTINRYSNFTVGVEGYFGLSF